MTANEKVTPVRLGEVLVEDFTDGPGIEQSDPAVGTGAS
ncbi:hypothetical protein JOC24_005846 [Streptomyces sp. HB132]|nr:hypothetical protein [Streptomyces sp. HB132]